MKAAEADNVQFEIDIIEVKKYLEGVFHTIKCHIEKMVYNFLFIKDIFKSEIENAAKKLNNELVALTQENERKTALIVGQKISAEEGRMLLIKRNAVG